MNSEMALIKEFGAAFNHKNKLVNQMQKLESELHALESISPEKTGKGKMQKSPKGGSGLMSSPSRTPLSPKMSSISPKSPKSNPSRNRRLDMSNKNNVNGQDSMNNFDARLKSIITSALLTPESRGGNIAERLSGKVSDEQRISPNSAKKDISPTSKEISQINWSADPSTTNADYTQVSPVKQALKRHLSLEKVGGKENEEVANTEDQNQSFSEAKQQQRQPATAGKYNEEKNSSPKMAPLTNGIVSLPVSIPLNTVNNPSRHPEVKAKASLPISIPLSSVKGSKFSNALQREPPPEANNSSVATGKRSPLIREVYSPISRPSSSSSTESADSESMRTAPTSGSEKMGNHFSGDSASFDGPPVAMTFNHRQAPGLAALSMAASTHYPLPKHNTPAATAAAAAANFHGNPYMPMMYGLGLGHPHSDYKATENLAKEKELYEKMKASNGTSKAHAQSYNAGRPFPISGSYPGGKGANSIASSVQLTTQAEEKPKKGRRRRSASKPPADQPTKKQAMSSGAKGGKRNAHLANAPEIASMVSNASQPLAITAISSPESSAKSSPADPNQGNSKVMGGAGANMHIAKHSKIGKSTIWQR